VRYAFIARHKGTYPVRQLCQVLEVHASGYYAWAKEPLSTRAKDDRRLLGLIKQFWIESGGVYGYHKIYTDLRMHGELCGQNRVHRLMRSAGLQAQVGYGRRRPKGKPGTVSVVAPNHLQQQFNAEQPDKTWVTDITYIRTHEGWLFLAVVLDLFSRRVIGWAMQPRMERDLVIRALLMAIWRRKPVEKVVIHSDQGSQFTSHEWQSFLKANNLECSMSRRGNCHDNAVAESFFQLLKRERIKRKIYTNPEEARSDIFDYIEMFYNTRRRHSYNDQQSPVEFERQYLMGLQGV
jgi:putative transposase